MQNSGLTIIFLSELVAIYLIYKIFKLDLPALSKILRSVMCLVPLVGPILYIIGFEGPAPNRPSMKQEEIPNIGSYSLENDRINENRKNITDNLD